MRTRNEDADTDAAADDGAFAMKLPMWILDPRNVFVAHMLPTSNSRSRTPAATVARTSNQCDQNCAITQWTSTQEYHQRGGGGGGEGTGGDLPSS